MKKVKIMCATCLKEVEYDVYKGLGVYVQPCEECKNERDKEVADVAKDYVLEETVTYFSELIEGALEKVVLDGESDTVEELETLNALLSKIAAGKKVPELGPDFCANLDI